MCFIDAPLRKAECAVDRYRWWGVNMSVLTMYVSKLKGRRTTKQTSTQLSTAGSPAVPTYV